MKLPLCIVLLLLFAAASPRSAASEDAPAAPTVEELETQWNGILERYLSIGEIEGVRVAVLDYAALKDAPEWAELVTLLPQIEVPEERAAAMALWINVYNILAVDLVLRDYPVDSIEDVGNFIRPVWKMDAGIVAGEMRTLIAIEHEILRQMGEPRIHAALARASVGSPDLRPEAYSAARLDAQLEHQMRDFLANPRKGARFDEKKNVLRISRIFDWFREDFDARGGVHTAVTSWLPNEVAATMTEKTDLKLLPYNWSLNDTDRAKEISAPSLVITPAATPE